MRESLNCLEIKDMCLKLAQFEIQKGIKKLSFLYAKSFPAKNEEEMINNLRPLVNKFKIGMNLVTCLGRNQVTVRYLKIPSKDPVEINQMIDFQIPKLIPYSKETTVYSWQILNTDISGYSNIILAIVHQEVISHHLNLLSKIGLDPKQVCFDALAIANWYLWDTKSVKETVLLIDVDWLSSNIEIIIDGALFFTRSVKIGTKNFQSKDSTKAIKGLIDEVRLSLTAYYKEEFAKKIDKIILSGASANLENLGKLLEKSFALKVEVKSSLEGIEFKQEVVKKKEFDMHLFSLTSVLGLGINLENININLLPEEIKQIKAKRTKIKEFVLSIILSFLIIFTSVGFFLKKFYDKSQYLNLIIQKINKVKNEAESLDERRRNLDLISDRFSEKNNCLDILLELHKIIPSQINLSSFDFVEGEGLNLKGSSSSMTEVFRLVSVLEKSSFFTNVQVRYAKKRAKQTNITDFEIRCLLAK